jgi:hypothetical protein
MEELTLLQPGVSGYGDQDKPPRVVDLKEFKTICHYAARQWGGDFIGTFMGEGSGNYYRSWFCHEHDSNKWIIGFLNAHYPFLAFSVFDPRVDEQWGRCRVPEQVSVDGSWFRNHGVFSDPNLVNPFSHSYRLLDIGELRERLKFNPNRDTRALTLVNCHLLGPSEMHSVFFHRAKIVAEVLYNKWG